VPPVRPLLPARTFALRLIVAVATAFAVVGAVGYFAMAQQLERRQIHDLATNQQADVASFEATGRAAASPREALRQVNDVIAIIGRRPGTIEALLIDRGRIVRASGSDPSAVGTRDADPRIDAALDRGEQYAGHEADPDADGRDFEFVAPVDLPSGRYAFEVTYGHARFDARLSLLRRTLIVLWLLAILVGGAVFYLVGGRALMRSHRLALRRAARDGLTDLPNQRAFHDDLAHGVALAQRQDQPFTLAVLDIDDFKFLNDRYGHPHGDAVLRRVAEVLGAGRSSDRAYRIGGDEFAVLFPATDAPGARAAVGRLVGNLADRGAAVSVGVATLRPGQAAEVLRAEADAALYQAKRLGRGGATYFEDIRDDVVVITPDKRDALRRLIEDNGLTTVYQPIWNLDTGTLLGIEALTRPDPAYGIASPAEAFDVAEQIGRVHELDVLCAERALEVAPRLPADALLFINLSPQTLDLDADGNDWLRLAVEHANLAPERVVVEVTERFGGRMDAIVTCLRRLREQGFKLAIDDVGTGNSGLEMLRHVGAEFVKLDRSMVAAATSEPSARAVLLAMASFALHTGSFVIAEGIEDNDTLAFLQSTDAEELRTGPVVRGGQGFGLGRPSAELPAAPPDLLVPAPAR
jgi:diguanylate cyclase (GGDEF)-like protein